MAAVRQNEMKVNITLVTTSTWLVDGPRRRGRSGALSPEGMAGGVPGGCPRSWQVIRRTSNPPTHLMTSTKVELRSTVSGWNKKMITRLRRNTVKVIVRPAARSSACAIARARQPAMPRQASSQTREDRAEQIQAGRLVEFRAEKWASGDKPDLEALCGRSRYVASPLSPADLGFRPTGTPHKFVRYHSRAESLSSTSFIFLRGLSSSSPERVRCCAFAEWTETQAEAGRFSSLRQHPAGP